MAMNNPHIIQPFFNPQSIYSSKRIPNKFQCTIRFLETLNMKQATFNNCILAGVFIFVSLLITETNDLHGQDSGKPTPVTVVFQNDTGNDVSVVFVSSKNEEGKNPAKIPNKQQVSITTTLPGQSWRIKDAKGNQLAAYAVTTASKSIVPLKDLIAWQTPVQLTFQNPTTATETIDILWQDAAGIEHRYTSLAPGKQVVTPVATDKTATMPNDRWTFRIQGELVADYTVSNAGTQAIDLSRLRDAFTKRVTLVFQNTTKQSFDIQFVTTDEKGKESFVLYAPNLVPGRQSIQVAQQGSVWRFVDVATAKEYGRFEALPDKTQVLDLGTGKTK